MPIDALVDLDEDALFSTPAVCRMARVTFRQLDYWSRTGTISPQRPASGSGSQRRFTATQVRDVAMIGRLRELGVSLDAIEEVVRVVDDSEGALIVIGPEFVRVASPLDIAEAIADANGAAIVVSPAALRILNADEQGCADARGRAPSRGRRPPASPRFRP